MQQLVKENRFAEVQRLFDLDAWQMFLAVNWPTNNQGQPAPAITDTAFGDPHWTPWQMSSQIYREDGKRPIACGRPPGNVALATAPMAQAPAPLLPHLAAPSPQALEDRSHLLLRWSARGGRCCADSGHWPRWSAAKSFDNIADLRRDEYIVRDVPYDSHSPLLGTDIRLTPYLMAAHARSIAISSASLRRS
jgi:hypothetical protein